MTHIHEVVYNLVHWFDDKIFRLYPTWDDCLRAAVFSSPQLEAFFGPNTNGGGGKANYTQCAERGIGRNVIAKMLAGTESDDAIRLEAELEPLELGDYDMLCCMIDENLTQQHVEPKTVFEIVAAAIKEAEKMLRETNNVYDFNAYFKNSRGLPSLLRENKSVRPGPDGRNPDWAPEEYTRAKLAIEPSGQGLGKDFLRHFLPPRSVASNSTLQATITAVYQEEWKREGDRLLAQSRLALWQGQEANDPDKIAAAIKEAEKMLRETNTVHNFNALFKRSRGLETLLSKSRPAVPPAGTNWRVEEYTKAKSAIEPYGCGLGREFIRHFLPKGTISSDGTLQAAITAYYQEYWQQEGDRLMEQSRLALWQGQEANDQERIATTHELEKQARALSTPRAHGSAVSGLVFSPALNIHPTRARERPCQLPA